MQMATGNLRLGYWKIRQAVLSVDCEYNTSYWLPISFMTQVSRQTHCHRARDVTSNHASRLSPQPHHHPRLPYLPLPSPHYSPHHRLILPPLTSPLYPRHRLSMPLKTPTLALIFNPMCLRSALQPLPLSSTPPNSCSNQPTSSWTESSIGWKRRLGQKGCGSWPSTLR